MNLTISDNRGRVIGTLVTCTETLWRDLLLYASTQWEAEAALNQGLALVKLLRERANAA